MTDSNNSNNASRPMLFDSHAHLVADDQVRIRRALHGVTRIAHLIVRHQVGVRVEQYRTRGVVAFVVAGHIGIAVVLCGILIHTSFKRNPRGLNHLFPLCRFAGH